MTKAKPDKIWGSPSISRALGVSVDAVYELAKDPAVPIYKPSGCFAYRKELEAWLPTKPASAT